MVSTGNRANGYDPLRQKLLALSHRSTQMIADQSFHSVEIDHPEVVVEAIRKVVGRARQAGRR